MKQFIKENWFKIIIVVILVIVSISYTAELNLKEKQLILEKNKREVIKMCSSLPNSTIEGNTEKNYKSCLKMNGFDEIENKRNDNQIDTTAKIENIVQNIKFDLNLNSLSYQLPDYTKICTPESRYDCSENNCKQNKPSVFVLYDENLNKVYRCDTQPCDNYTVLKEVSGLYTNLTPIKPNGSLVKITNDNKYVETVSIGLDFIIYRGKCTDKK